MCQKTWNDPKIEVFLVPSNEPEDRDVPYHYVVLAWSDGSCWWNGLNGDQMERTIMPGTEHGCWYNTGIVGWEATPEAAFAEGLKAYREWLCRGYTAT